MSFYLQVAGSVLCLIAFVLAQAKRVRSDRLPFLVLNVVGSGALGISAAMNDQYGFLMLETVWTAVSAFGLCQALTRLRPRPDNSCE
jgi:hypothetical protein